MIYGDAGVSLWNVDRPQQSLLEEFGTGRWQLVFLPSGASVVAGRPDIGFQVYSSDDGQLVGPAIGVRDDAFAEDLLASSDDEQLLLTGSVDNLVRVWRAPSAQNEDDANRPDRRAPGLETLGRPRACVDARYQSRS